MAIYIFLMPGAIATEAVFLELTMEEAIFTVKSGHFTQIHGFLDHSLKKKGL